MGPRVQATDRRLPRLWRSCGSSSYDLLSLRRLLEEVPNLPRGVKVAVGIAEQARTVRGGMRCAVAAALNPDERHAALAGRGPTAAFGGAAVARIAVGKLRRFRRTG